MSYVYNIILTFNDLDLSREIQLEKINRYFKDDIFPENKFNFVNNEGGTKCLEARVATGAFNGFDEDEFINHINNIQWVNIEYFQIFIKHQDDERFRMINVF